eukprot:scaffold53893_cov65-Attheya_sp.AAC.1
MPPDWFLRLKWHMDKSATVQSMLSYILYHDFSGLEKLASILSQLSLLATSMLSKMWSTVLVVWRKYCTVKETHDEAMAWFWLASWPVTWEMMDRFVCVFCGVADCCEEDVVAVDCCEGGGLHSYKGIMILLLAVKGFQVHAGGWSFQRGFIICF